MPSMSILLNELFKLLHHAGAQDVEFFRLGTCGGIGLDPGTVVVTTEALNGELRPIFEQVNYTAIVDCDNQYGLDLP